VNITKAHFMAPVRDMNRALGFYRDVLGLQVSFGSPEWTELAWCDGTIALHVAASVEEHERESRLGFEVEELDAAADEIEANLGSR
jgi:catechol 2,3-dioxygenase-like lactoylglutathione lyase family enzyme